ncbi:hypothetical protein OF001_U10494 [Pseudomonas sp. OF001]|nr:hypothetical protein OF001_U10494 [Pseudomonas sp. OF001]
MLEGERVYRHGNPIYPMQPGSSLTGKPLHTPVPIFRGQSSFSCRPKLLLSVDAE